MNWIQDTSVVLFQGDSITDAGRSREDLNHLGQGYAMMAAAWFFAHHPQLDVKFINRGISGNRASDLKNRWQEDCIDLNPDLISIFIGINDCWRRYDRNDPTSKEVFESHYRYLLEEIHKKTKARVLLCEPFLLPVPEDRKLWREDLDPKIDVVRTLAREYKTLLLPLDGIMNSAAAYKTPGFWAPDGVHPSAAGHALIARKWLEITGAI